MLNIFDLFLIIVTLGLAISGFREGLLRGAVKLAGFIATIIILAYFSKYIAETAHLIGKIPSKIAVPIVFIAFFIIATIGFHVLAEILYKFVKITPIKFIDSGLGCMFGIVKSLFLSGILALILSFAPSGTFFYNQYHSSNTAKTMKTFICGTTPVFKSLIPLYQKHTPFQRDQDKKKDEESYPDNII